MACDGKENVLPSSLVLRKPRDKRYGRCSAVCKLWNSGCYVVTNVESDSAIRNSLVTKKKYQTSTSSRCKRRCVHVSIWTTDIDSNVCKGRLDFGEQPGIRSETSNEGNWLNLISLYNLKNKLSWFTDIMVGDAAHCSLIAFTIHWKEGSKNEATSELERFASINSMLNQKK